MKVAEKFLSINGEGLKAGQIAAFIRFVGCNLRCTYCDTVWAQTGDCDYIEMSEEEIYDYVRRSGARLVTLTGGEPLLSVTDSLLKKLSEIDDIRIEIETNGSVYIGSFRNIEKVSFTLDYKLSGSGMEKFMNTENYKFLRNTDCVKFVVSDKEDLYKAKEIIEKYSLDKKCTTIFSPVFGKIEPVEIVNFMLCEKLFDSRFQLQLHKFVWSPDTKGV